MHITIYSQNFPGDQFISTEHIKKIKEVYPDCLIVITDSPDQISQNTEVLIAVKPLDSLSFTTLPHLNWVHVTSAGVDKLPHELKNSSIIVTNSSGVHPIPIAEQIFTYMLMFARGIDKTTWNQFEKKWDRAIPVFELHGKTIGIVGLGRIGKKVAEIAKAFNMTVYAIAKHTGTDEHVDKMLTIENLPQLLDESDFVVNCLPGTEETRGIFTINTFNQMKQTAYFISIGRGFSTVEKDLVTALEEKIIKGAALDVFETEPLPSESPLWQMQNVIITPHTAGKTPFYMDRVIRIFCENLKAYGDKKPLPNEIDKKAGY